MGSKKSKKRSGGLDELAGYKVLPVRFDSEGALHYLYFRQHSSTKEDILMPSDRTIFMTNLPADTTERDIRRLFQGVARIARVVFHGVDLAPVPRTQLLESGASAHIVLLEVGELANVLSIKAGAITMWPQRDPESANPADYRGLSRYLYEYRASRPPAELLKTEVDSYMEKFEAAQYERDRMLSQQQNVPDEDGFITVVRRGRHTKNTDGSVSVTAASADDARAAGSKKKEVLFGNMYRFQMRERKNNQLLELRKKFEQDKEKIARMRQARQFRPY
ncbi:SSU rRNA processing protein [Coemansia mojavensis]|nr:SSU rRNA processing protein [Coemansia mojavensis]